MKEFNHENLVQLGKSNLKRLTDLATRAFFGDPYYVSVIPDERKRRKLLLNYFRLVLKVVLDNGFIFSTDSEGRDFVTCFPPSLAKRSFLKGLAKFLKIVPSLIGFYSKKPLRVLARIYREGSRYSDESVKDLPPHWYLGYVVVDPDFQGQGRGKNLIDAMKQMVIKHNYGMVTNSEEEIFGFFTKLGFEIFDEFTISENIKLYMLKFNL